MSSLAVRPARRVDRRFAQFSLRLAPRLTLALATIAPSLAAQDGGYQQPPAPIAQILDAEPTPAVTLGPTREWLLLLERRPLPPISEVGAPILRLAGDRLDPRTNTLTREVSYKGLRLRSVNGTIERRIATPGDARIANVRWSDDGASAAFTVTTDSGASLWLASVATGAARALTRPILNGAMGAPCEWLDGTRFLCRTIVAARGAAPRESVTPAGPVSQQSTGRAAPNRTYEDLLQSPFDEAEFDYYFTSQLAIVGTDGSLTPLGAPAIYFNADPSPDGKHILVETVHRPYSYLVPMDAFPRRVEIWDVSGKVEAQVADLPLQEEVGTSFDAVPAGPRDLDWRADAPATLVWTEALDGGNPNTKAAKRDRLRALAAPFAGEAATLGETEFRVGGITWGKPGLAIVSEQWWKTRRARTWKIDPDAPGTAPTLLFDRSSEDRYANPGGFVTAPNAHGRQVLLFAPDGRSAYLTGAGASAEGDRPFLDRYAFGSAPPARLWRSAAPYYEEVVAVLDPGAKRILTRRESVTEAPNYVVRDVGANRVTPLTAFKDPAPQFAGVSSQLITYTRADGVRLSAKLYLPAGYSKEKQGRLPFLFWAYPQEFKTAAAAAQVIGSPYRFTRPTGPSHLFVLTQGYGVLDGPTMPIIGEGTKEPNDTYVDQLVASAQAAVDKVVEMGVADRDRIAVGGHSYGAFMTANLLSHSHLFRAGIARSGAYNRTLTPFGFQAEERDYWKARDIYTRMSPFSYADSVSAPILLIHGMADDNSGTFPIQSERYYAALKGNGKVARLVMLPAEAHGYRARESIGHTLWEMVAWLDKYVRPVRKPNV